MSKRRTASVCRNGEQPELGHYCPPGQADGRSEAQAAQPRISRAVVTHHSQRNRLSRTQIFHPRTCMPTHAACKRDQVSSGILAVVRYSSSTRFRSVLRRATYSVHVRCTSSAHWAAVVGAIPR